MKSSFIVFLLHNYFRNDSASPKMFNINNKFLMEPAQFTEKTNT